MGREWVVIGDSNPQWQDNGLPSGNLSWNDCQVWSYLSCLLVTLYSIMSYLYSVMNDPPLFPFPLCHPFVSPFLDPYWTFTSTSMLSPSSPTSLDLLYDSFYESFLFLAYDSFRLIAWVTPIFRYDSLWLILRVILIFRPSDPPMTHSMSHLYT